jgi:hypothetical protein
MHCRYGTKVHRNNIDSDWLFQTIGVLKVLRRASNEPRAAAAGRSHAVHPRFANIRSYEVLK